MAWRTCLICVCAAADCWPHPLPPRAVPMMLVPTVRGGPTQRCWTWLSWTTLTCSTLWWRNAPSSASSSSPAVRRPDGSWRTVPAPPTPERWAAAGNPHPLIPHLRPQAYTLEGDQVMTRGFYSNKRQQRGILRASADEAIRWAWPLV